MSRSGPHRTKRLKGTGEPEKLAQILSLTRELKERCARLGIPFADALPALVNAKTNPMGELDQSHPGPLGYDLLAEFVETTLRERGLLR